MEPTGGAHDAPQTPQSSGEGETPSQSFPTPRDACGVLSSVPEVPRALNLRVAQYWWQPDAIVSKQPA